MQSELSVSSASVSSSLDSDVARSSAEIAAPMTPVDLPSYDDIGDNCSEGSNDYDSDNDDGGDGNSMDQELIDALADEFEDPGPDDSASDDGGNNSQSQRFCGNVPKDSVVGQYLDSIRRNILDDRHQVHHDIKNGHVWITPPCPVNAISRRVQLNPDSFYYPRVYVFIPHLSYPNYAVHCPHCPSKVCSCVAYVDFYHI